MSITKFTLISILIVIISQGCDISSTGTESQDVFITEAKISSTFNTQYSYNDETFNLSVDSIKFNKYENLPDSVRSSEYATSTLQSAVYVTSTLGDSSTWTGKIVLIQFNTANDIEAQVLSDFKNGVQVFKYEYLPDKQYSPETRYFKIIDNTILFHPNKIHYEGVKSIFNSLE